MAVSSTARTLETSRRFFAIARGLFDGQDSRDLATLLRDRQVAVSDPFEGVEIVELVEQQEQGSLRLGVGRLAHELDGPGVIEGGVGADDRLERSRLHQALLEGDRKSVV